MQRDVTLLSWQWNCKSSALWHIVVCRELYSAPSRYLKQCWLFGLDPLKQSSVWLEWMRNDFLSIKYVKMSTILFRPRCVKTSQWRHNEGDGVSNHQRIYCLLKRLFRRRSKKISKLCIIGLCEGNSPVTGEFPAQRAGNAENVSIISKQSLLICTGWPWLTHRYSLPSFLRRRITLGDSWHAPIGPGHPVSCRCPGVK